MFKRLWQQRTWSSSTSSAGRFIVAFCYLVTAMHICAWNDQLGFPHKMLTLIFSCAFYTAKWIITQVPHDLMTPWFNQNIIWMKMFDTKLDCEKWERTSGGGFTMFVMWYTWLEFNIFFFFFSKQTFDFCEKMRGIFDIAWSWSRFLRRRLSVSHLSEKSPQLAITFYARQIFIQCAPPFEHLEPHLFSFIFNLDCSIFDVS